MVRRYADALSVHFSPRWHVVAFPYHITPGIPEEHGVKPIPEPGQIFLVIWSVVRARKAIEPQFIYASEYPRYTQCPGHLLLVSETRERSALLLPDVPLDRTRAAASNGAPFLPSYLGDAGIKISGYGRGLTSRTYLVISQGWVSEVRPSRVSFVAELEIR